MSTQPRSALKRGGTKTSGRPTNSARGNSRQKRTVHNNAPLGGLPPRTAALIAGGVLAAAALAVLFTGGRAQALGSAVNDAIDGRLAAAGLKLRAVHIQGASPDALPHVQAALGVYRDQPLARLDLDAVKARVEAVGWVADAKVVRLLPDTLVVAVEERQALAVWQHQGRAVVIDAEGRPIPEADPARFGRLPLVVGEGADQAAATVIPLVRSRPRLTERLEALVRVDTRRWDLRLKDGSLVQLPAIDEDSALIQLDQLDERARVLELGFARIDLRDPEMIAVRPRNTRLAAEPAAGGA